MQTVCARFLSLKFFIVVISVQTEAQPSPTKNYVSIMSGSSSSLLKFGFTLKRRAEEREDPSEDEADEDLRSDASLDDSASLQPEKVCSGSAKRCREPEQRRTRKFLTSWQADPLFKSWLTFSAGEMRCRLCMACKKENNFTRGCEDMRRSDLLRHIDPNFCVDHQRAVEETEAQKALAQTAEAVVTKHKGAITLALKASYWLAKEELPSSKLPSLVSLFDDVGVEGVRSLNVEDPTRRGQRLTYTSSNSISDFHKALNRFVEDNLLTVVNNSPVLGVMCHESSDNTVTRHCLLKSH